MGRFFELSIDRKGVRKWSTQHCIKQEFLYFFWLEEILAGAHRVLLAFMHIVQEKSVLSQSLGLAM